MCCDLDTATLGPGLQSVTNYVGGFEQIRSDSHEILAIRHDLAKFELVTDKIVAPYYRFCYSTDNLLIHQRCV